MFPTFFQWDDSSVNQCHNQLPHPHNMRTANAIDPSHHPQPRDGVAVGKDEGASYPVPLGSRLIP